LLKRHSRGGFGVHGGFGAGAVLGLDCVVEYKTLRQNLWISTTSSVDITAVSLQIT
jgi:hypothetical protein